MLYFFLELVGSQKKLGSLREEIMVDPKKNREEIFNLAIIGVGYWGPNYARLCFELEGINLRWCADLDKTALEKMNKNIAKFFNHGHGQQ